MNRPWLILVLLVLASAGAAVHATGSATAHVRQTTDLLLAEVHDADSAGDALRAARRVLAPNLDGSTASRLVLGPTWRRADALSRERFQAAFEELLLRTYTSAILDAGIPAITYLAERGKPDRSRVRTRVELPDGRKLAVDYRVRRDLHRWKIFDLIVEGVSLVATFRIEFGAVTKARGLNALIERLEAGNAQ